MKLERTRVVARLYGVPQRHRRVRRRRQNGGDGSVCAERVGGVHQRVDRAENEPVFRRVHHEVGEQLEIAR